MIKHKLYLTGILCVLVNLHSFSQTEELSLSRAWEIAFADYPGLAEKEALIKEAQYGKRELANSFLPNVQAQLQGSYGTFYGSSGAFFPLSGTLNVSGNNVVVGSETATANSFGSVLVDWKVFEFGRQRKAMDAAAATVSEAMSSFHARKLSLQRDVAERYTDVLYNIAKRKWAEDNALRVRKILALSQGLAEAGLKPGADTLLARSSYLQSLAALDDWTGRYSASKIRLAEVVRVDTAIIPGHSANFLTRGIMPDHADSVARSHPYLRVVEDRIEYHQLRGEVASRAFLPTLSLLGGVSTRGSGISGDGSVNTEWDSGFGNQRNNYLIGLGLTWNISDAFNSITERNRIKQLQAASQSRYAEHTLQANTALSAAATRVHDLIQQTLNTSAAVQNAQGAYDLYLARYESGLINLSELLQIQLLLQQAEKTNIEAYAEYWKQVIVHSELSADFTYLSIHFN